MYRIEKGVHTDYHKFDNKVALDIIYYPTYNDYNGKRSIQITIESYRL